MAKLSSKTEQKKLPAALGRSHGGRPCLHHIQGVASLLRPLVASALTGRPACELVSRRKGRLGEFW